jgi:pimeloyl-ACP methyl ester carboxylesterase
MITRAFVDVGERRVHYRWAGSGPVLLMAHQSPRSSAEYEPLILEWAENFTCIAPDTPGFGQSDPLPGSAPDIDDFADALIALLDALGLGQVAAYGFHSGGIILVTALKRHPERFTALAVGGYAVWTPQEMAVFGERYLPPLLPSGYGDHLTWLWNRVLEQTWFFPWFAAEPEHRLSVAHDDPARVDATVQDMLAAGNAYRAGYGAVLRAPRDIPAAGAVTPPVLITAYDGDPLQAHIDRLGALPAGWEAAKVATPAEHHARSLAFLIKHPGRPANGLAASADEGFVDIAGHSIHWRGRTGDALVLHAPGESLELVDLVGLAVDLPGHGLSSAWDGTDFAALIAAIAEHFACTHVLLPPAPRGDPDLLFPSLAPDRFGAHLTRAWAIVRARHLFAPWYAATAAHALPFAPEALDPERLAIEHRALLRAMAARDWCTALQTMERH